MKSSATKLAIIATHPIQYYSPWYKYIASKTDIKVKVFYLWDFGVKTLTDKSFKATIKWDVPLLEGYDYEFVPNISYDAGSHHFFGLINPALHKRIKLYQPDVVLLTAYRFASLCHFILRWNQKDAPIIFRGDSHRIARRKRWNSQLKQGLLALLFCRFSACLYVGKANREYFRYHKVPDSKLYFSPHAIDNDRFCGEAKQAISDAVSWKRTIGIPENHRVILFAGKFEQIKRPEDLLIAFKKANLTNVSMLFVGSGQLENELRNKAGKHKDIYFAPLQNQSLMPRTYAAADIVVLPSYAESWGLCINEAMCISRPVIVSSHVGCAQDLVQSGENGLVFPAGDIDALATCFKEVFSDRIKLKAWGEEGRKKIDKYSYQQATKGLLEAIGNQLIKHKGNAQN